MTTTQQKIEELVLKHNNVEKVKSFYQLKWMKPVIGAMTREEYCKVCDEAGKKLSGGKTAEKPVAPKKPEPKPEPAEETKEDGPVEGAEPEKEEETKEDIMEQLDPKAKKAEKPAPKKEEKKPVVKEEKKEKPAKAEKPAPKKEEKKPVPAPKKKLVAPKEDQEVDLGVEQALLCTNDNGVKVEAAVITVNGETYFTRNVFYAETFGKATEGHFKVFHEKCSADEAAEKLSKYTSKFAKKGGDVVELKVMESEEAIARAFAKK